MASSVAWSSSLSWAHSVGRTISDRNGPKAGERTARAMPVFAQKKGTKTRKIILKEDVSEVGKKGELLQVKAGFFRNYLFPLGKAQIVTPVLLKEIDVICRSGIVNS